jgi:3-methyl-2-oxobutanoate hydroxymethyltransferase
MSYTSLEQAMHNVARLMQEGGAEMVKLEGGAHQVEIISQLSYQGVPICAHLGLQPQSVYKLGGYRVQGREDAQAIKMLEDALILQEAGADVLVLECVPTQLAAKISQSLDIPTIGIGAGADCDGQVLVLHDMLGISEKAPKFSHNFLPTSNNIQAAIAAFHQAVKNHDFPTDAHSFS